MRFRGSLDRKNNQQGEHFCRRSCCCANQSFIARQIYKSPATTEKETRVVPFRFWINAHNVSFTTTLEKIVTCYFTGHAVHQSPESLWYIAAWKAGRNVAEGVKISLLGADDDELAGVATHSVILQWGLYYAVRFGFGFDRSFILQSADYVRKTKPYTKTDLL